jgi:hypothetical protein
MAIVERLSRYREFAAFHAKYAHADFVIDEEADRSAKNAGSAGKTAADADAFARDI